MWIDVIHMEAERRDKAFRLYARPRWVGRFAGEGDNTAGNAERRPLEEHQATQQARVYIPRLLHQRLRVRRVFLDRSFGYRNNQRRWCRARSRWRSSMTSVSVIWSGT